MQNVLSRTSSDKIHLKIDEGHEFALCMVVPEKIPLGKRCAEDGRETEIGFVSNLPTGVGTTGREYPLG
jgi:hypothetical protein